MNAMSRDPSYPVRNLAIGKVIEVDGTRLIAELSPDVSELSRIHDGEVYPIGQFGSIVRIHYGRRLLFAFVSRLRMKAEYEAERGVTPQPSSDERIIEAELFGEGEWVRSDTSEFSLQFERGISNYPLPQQSVYLTPKSELRVIYGSTRDIAIHLGDHVGVRNAPCYADMNELLGKHTAVLGSTGTGKSATVAWIIHSILLRGSQAKHSKWNPRIVILDPHDEYGAAFTENSTLSTDDGSLHLPYWLLDYHETLALLIGKTEFLATTQANIVKNALLHARHEGADLLGLDKSRITVDSPVPYRLSTLRGFIEADKPPQPSKQDRHNSILQKLDTLTRDARMSFMISEWEGCKTDPFAEVLARLLAEGPQPKIVDLSGVPNEVAGIASAAVARIIFNSKTWQTNEERKRDPILLVCEEAHRYVPHSGEAQYEDAQESIRRIAKEGRKYGIGLLLVSQRPSELDQTVLSQCNSWLVLRISNESDRERVKSVLPDSLSGLSRMLSGLRRREAIVAGEAVAIPSRVLIKELSNEQLTDSSDIDFDVGWQHDAMSTAQINELARRWRYQTR